MNDGATLKTRYAWNVSADTTVFSTRDQNGTAAHNVSFNVTAPGAYFLTVSTQRTGDMNRINDASGCDGSADVSAVTGNQSGGTLTSGTLSLGDPGSIPTGGSDTSGPFNQTATARIDNTSNGVAKSHTLSFSWNGSARSNSCEAAVRLGEGSSVSGCDACSYPGSPSRTQSQDGHFVTVTLTSLCGNGVIDSAQGEQCDTAIAGSVCCDVELSLREPRARQCRAAAGVCDVAENCTGSCGDLSGERFQVEQLVVCRPAAGVSATSPRIAPARAPPVRLTASRRARPCAGRPRASATSPSTAPARSPPVRRTRFASTPRPCCRASAGVCDVAENCTGSSAPVRRTPSRRARPSAAPPRVCDLAEHCTGSSTACPADVKEHRVCRAAAGLCDVGRELRRRERRVSARRAATLDDRLPRRRRRLRRRRELRRREHRLPARRQEHGGLPRRRRRLRRRGKLRRQQQRLPRGRLAAGDLRMPSGAGGCDVPESCTGNDPGVPGRRLRAGDHRVSRRRRRLRRRRELHRQPA